MNKKNQFLAILLITGIIIWGVSYYVAETEKEIKLALTARIAEQEKTLQSLAELTDRNSADAVVGSIIRDCSEAERNEFDNLLNNLGTLSVSGLNEIETLFEACADFESNLKAVMVARMQREFEVYKDYVGLATSIDGRSENVLYPIDSWNELVNFETRRAELLAEQVVIQGDIITALQSGVGTQSEVIQNNLFKAREVVESFSVLDLQIDELRAQLSDV